MKKRILAILAAVIVISSITAASFAATNDPAPSTTACPYSTNGQMYCGGNGVCDGTGRGLQKQDGTGSSEMRGRRQGARDGSAKGFGGRGVCDGSCYATTTPAAESTK
jgi:hypothetical protein